MTKPVKKSRCAFVVIKFLADGKDCFLMRENRHWRDVNFIGGHENDRDGGELLRTARRELLEEVPALRQFKSFQLSSLGPRMSHGPVFSRSAEQQVEYILEFIVLKFLVDPRPVLEALGPRTPNILVCQEELLNPRTRRMSELVGVLDRGLDGGINSIPYSWLEDVGDAIVDRDQLHLPFC